MSRDQSPALEALRRSYGGSEPTHPSFLRPQHVRYNSLLKSRDLGRLDNLSAILGGEVGSQSGASTLFFRVETSGLSRLGVSALPGNRYDASALRVGICDADHKPLPLDVDGYATLTRVHNQSLSPAPDRLPGGVYYFTVSSERWATTAFQVLAVVQRYLEIEGKAGGTMLPRLRLALVKLNGAASGTGDPRGTVRAPQAVKTLGGSGGGTATLFTTMAIPRGVAGGTLAPYGRLKQTFRVVGAAIGQSSGVATMTASRPYGSGY